MRTKEVTLQIGKNKKREREQSKKIILGRERIFYTQQDQTKGEILYIVFIFRVKVEMYMYFMSSKQKARKAKVFTVFVA